MAYYLSGKIGQVRTKTTITSKKPFLFLPILATYNYRDFFYYLSLRDITLRYRYKTIGILWVAIQPLLFAGALSLSVGRVSFFQESYVPYLPFAFSGLLFWTYLTNSLGRLSISLLSNVQLIKSVSFPRIIIPLAGLSVGLFDFCIGFIVLIILLFFYQIPINFGLFLIMLTALFLTVIYSLGVGTLFAALQARYRDIREILPFTVTLLFFLTPVMYPVRIIPQEYHWLLYLNPMTGIIELVRAALFPGIHLNLAGFFVSVVMNIAILILGLLVFEKIQEDIADSL